MPLNLALKQNAVTGKYQSNWSPFPLRTEYFIAAKMPLNVIFPRPDIETQAHARQKWAHTDFPMVFPIGVQGGAWPFKYEVLYDPSGAVSIGGFYGQANYGVVEVDNTLLEAATSYDYTIRVTGQDGVYTDIARTFAVDNSKFVIVQDGYAGTQVGTIDQPLEDIDDWYLNSDTDNTYLNKIIVFRGGNYTATGNSAANPANIVLNQTYKTPSIIGFPEEVPIWDMTNAKVYDNSGIDDLFVEGITFDGYRDDVTNAHHFWMAGGSNRATFHGCTFKNIGAGTVGSDNANPIYFGDISSQKSYFYVADCVFDAVNNAAGANGGFIDIYKSDQIVFERNIAKNSTTTYGFWLKTSRSFISVRGNVAIENNNGSMITLSMGSSTGGTPNNIEICYNAVAVPVGQGGDALILINDTDWQNDFFDIYFYRNSVFGGTTRIGFADAEPIYTDANIIVTNDIARFDPTKQTVGVASYVTLPANAIIDSECELIGSAGFATHGWRSY